MHSKHPSPLGFDEGLIPCAAFFICDFPFVAFVRKRMSSQQQDLPDTSLFRGGLTFGSVASSTLLPIEITSLASRTVSTIGKCGGPT